MNSFSKIRDIFYSGSHAFMGNHESINDIAFLVDEHYLILEEISIANKRKYFEFFDNPSVYKESVGEAAGGGLAHVALKKLSGQYLLDKRGLNVYYEHPFVGYYPDVISKDKFEGIVLRRPAI